MKVTMLGRVKLAAQRPLPPKQTRTSNETMSSASAMLYTTCQKMLQACTHPFFEGEENVYASRSGPPFGRTIMAYTCDTENVSWG